MPRRSQLDLPLQEKRTWGGKRRRAGRKPNGSRALVSRSKRPVLNGRHPVHVTMRVLGEIPSLRVLNGWVRRALLAGADQPGFRLIHFSIQGNHLHLIVEAEDTVRLSRGMQGLAVRISSAVNRALSRRRGKVFSDRYHAHVLRTWREVQNAVAYVIENFRRHREKGGRPVAPSFVDSHTSAAIDPGTLPSPQFRLLKFSAVPWSRAERSRAASVRNYGGDA
jgi:putative transposase